MEIRPAISGWYGPTPSGSSVYSLDGSRPRKLTRVPLIVGEWLYYEPQSSAVETFAPLLGVTLESFVCMFRVENVLRHWDNDTRPMDVSLRVLADGFPLPGEPVIFLGRRVAEAFGHEGDHFKWARTDFDGEPGKPATVLPAPGEDRQSGQAASMERTLRSSLLYHAKMFRIGDYPHGRGSLVMIQHGEVWGDAARRLRHKAKQ